MTERKCRESVIFRTTKIVRGKVIRSSAPIRCDLVAGHEGQHWLALLTPFKPKVKTRQIGYVYWDITDLPWPRGKKTKKEES